MKTKEGRTDCPSIMEEKLEAVVAERGKGDERNCHPRKRLDLTVERNTGKLVKVRLKNTRAMEMWYNKQITENIQEITTLNIIKMENLWH